MRYKNRITTDIMLSEALASKTSAFEINRGEQTIEVWIAPHGTVNWYINGKTSNELKVSEMLAQWAVEGAI